MPPSTESTSAATGRKDLLGPDHVAELVRSCLVLGCDPSEVKRSAVVPLSRDPYEYWKETDSDYRLTWYDGIQRQA
jgi:hypothetical protein